MNVMRKGSLFLSMIMLLVVYLFAIAVVVVFFYFFKFHIITTILDEYRWNKIQEVPLDLFSMDINGESFVSRMNKVYYGFYDSPELKAKIQKTVYDQCFYLFGGDPKGTVFSLYIEKFNVVSANAACTCDYNWGGTAMKKNRYLCSSDCPKYKAGEETSCEKYDIWSGVHADISKCFTSEVLYNAVFPFPLTFNGTEIFTANLNYEVVFWT